MITLDASAGAMRLESRRLSVSARNVANVNTPNYRSRSLNQTSLQPGGVRSSGVTAGTDETSSPPDPKPSTVEFSEEARSRISSSASFDANAGALKTQDEMTGTVLDLLA